MTTKTEGDEMPEYQCEAYAEDVMTAKDKNTAREEWIRAIKNGVIELNIEVEELDH